MNELNEHPDKYKGRKVYARKGSKFARKPGVIRGMRHCTLEGCGRDRVLVVWPDGRRTWPCLAGMVEQRDGSFRIT